MRFFLVAFMLLIVGGIIGYLIGGFLGYDPWNSAIDGGFTLSALYCFYVYATAENSSKGGKNDDPLRKA